MLHNCATENAIIREGHKPHKSTIEQALNAKAHSGDQRADKVNKALWKMRLARA